MAQTTRIWLVSLACFSWRLRAGARSPDGARLRPTRRRFCLRKGGAWEPARAPPDPRARRGSAAVKTARGEDPAAVAARGQSRVRAAAPDSRLWGPRLVFPPLHKPSSLWGPHPARSLHAPGSRSGRRGRGPSCGRARGSRRSGRCPPGPHPLPAHGAPRLSCDGPAAHFMLDAALANTPSLTFPVSTGLASWTYHPVTPVVRATPSPGEQQKRRGSAKWPCTPPPHRVGSTVTSQRRQRGRGVRASRPASRIWKTTGDT